jgi:hypothetical protein
MSKLLIILMLSAACVFADDLPPLPETLEVAGERYEIVFHKLDRSRIMMPTEPQLPAGFRVERKEALEGLGKQERYWLEGQSFLRPPDSALALPLQGSAAFVGYVDREQQKFQRWDAFPATGEASGKRFSPRYEWCGVLDLVDPTGMWLFVRRWNRQKKAHSAYRGRVKFASPADAKFVSMDFAIEQVMARREGELLCRVIESRARHWLRLSTKDWSVIARGKPVLGNTHLGPATYSPDGKQIFLLYSSQGLAIFDAATGERKSHHPSVGRFANAVTDGVSFSPDGETAVVTAPYAHNLTLLNVADGTIIATYKTQNPLRGLRFDKAAHKAHIYETFLPYE